MMNMPQLNAAPLPCAPVRDVYLAPSNGIERKYTITNLTADALSINNKVVTSQGTVDVTHLTDELLAGYKARKLDIYPPPNGSNDPAQVTIALSDLPLPVRIYGNFRSLFTPSRRIPGGALNVTAAETVIVLRNDARCEVRLRNSGSQPVAVGGQGVQYATAVNIIGPGEVYVEQTCPNVPLYGICATGQTSTLLVEEVIADNSIV